jgi:hypothetical protein
MTNGNVDTAAIVNALKAIAQELAYIRSAIQTIANKTKA